MRREMIIEENRALSETLELMGQAGKEVFFLFVTIQRWLLS